jgi:hypothetical protein
VVLFDPLDPGKICTVVRAPDGEQGRALVERERVLVAVDYDLADDESWIRIQRGGKEQFLEGLKIAGRYMTPMQRIFRDEGLPVELAYLPLVESSFNVRARSSVGAVGMWQFMPETGRKFMRVDTAVDERRDPMRSTRAAARLLKENYRILGNWPLVITAYNHGTKVEIATHIDSYFPFLRPHRPGDIARSGGAAADAASSVAQTGGDFAARLLRMESGAPVGGESDSDWLSCESAAA